MSAIGADAPKRLHAPFWAQCRWYRRCDMADLRQTAGEMSYVTAEVKTSVPPPASPAPAPPGSPRSLRVALATVAARACNGKGTCPRYGYDIKCSMLQWGQSARRLQQALPAGWMVRIVVLGDNLGWLNASAGCEMEELNVQPMLRDAARACSTTLAASSYELFRKRGQLSGTGYVHDSSHFKYINMLKVALLGLSQFDLVIFADADLELVPFAEDNPTRVASAWVRAASRLLASDAMLVADPDNIAPLNTGLMLLRPSASAYAEAVTLLQRCRFKRSTGWENIGPPSAHEVLPLQLRGRRRGNATKASMRQDQSNRKRLRRTLAYKSDSWDFTSADCDQGLYWYLFFVRHRRGAFGSEAANRKHAPPRARHWWASFKPWRANPLGEDGGGMTEAEYATAIAFYDPGQLVRLYDYVASLNEPSDSPSQLLLDSVCWQGQTRLRRAIEGHAHFWEVFEWWQKWQGAGAWAELPS